MNKWGTANRALLTSLSYGQALREQNVGAIQQQFQGLHALYPSREWRYWSAESQPRLLAFTANITEAGRRRAEANILSRGYFQQALKGIPSYGVVKFLASGQACLMVSVQGSVRPAAGLDA